MPRNESLNVNVMIEKIDAHTAYNMFPDGVDICRMQKKLRSGPSAPEKSDAATHC